MLYASSLSLRPRLWLSGLLIHAAWALGCSGADEPAVEPDGQPTAEQARAAEETQDETGSDDEPPTPAPASEAALAGAPARQDTARDTEPGARLLNERDEERDDERDEGKERATNRPGPSKGRFQLTYYWMAHEKRRKRARKMRIYNSKCKPIARVSRTFAARLALEGTGTLRDGRVVNVAGSCACDHSPCFFVVDEDHKRWGVGVGDRPLAPFRSVAVDPSKVSIGTKLYIPELDGLVMPGAPPWGGFVHDGCVIADDRGGGVAGKQLDFFMVRKPYYRAFHRRHRLTQVTVHAGGDRCAREGKDLLPVDRNSI